MKPFMISLVVLVTLFLNAVVALADITNGDFTLGNASFTSDYAYVSEPSTITDALFAEGTYAVGVDPKSYHRSWATYGDHTTGSGNMMIVNGAGSDIIGRTIWRQDTAVTENTDYYLSVWVASSYSLSPAVLTLNIAGAPIGVPFTASTTTGLWQQFYAKWNSGSNTLVSVSLFNQNTALSGNDFTLDDIALSTTKPTGGTDTTVVPVPPTLLLLGSGLIGLVGLRRKKYFKK